jgi:tetratricopeptide (TPR) repeat protein
MRKYLSMALVAMLLACGPKMPATAPAPEQTQGRDEWLFQQGLLAGERGDGVRAEQYLSLARDRGYPAERVLPALLKVCLASSRLRAALDYAEPYLRQHPEQDALRFLVANIHAGLGQSELALAELERLLQNNAAFDQAYFLRGTLLFDRDGGGAIEALRAYLDLAPRGVHAAEARSRLSELLQRDALSQVQLMEPTP